MTITNLEPDPHPAIRVSMMPADTNAHGTIFGGKILSLIDQAGAIGVHRLGVGRVVTVAMREVVFSQPVRVGDIVAALLPGPAEDEATVKRLKRTKNRILLVPENPAFEPFDMDPEGRILGKVVAVLRRL